jgi:hypothetical protein
MRFPIQPTDAPTLRALARLVIKHRVAAAGLTDFAGAITSDTLTELSAPVRELVDYIGRSFINAGPRHVAALLRLFAQQAETAEAVAP